MRAVSRGLKIPFKKLDPLELDMATVTKTIPRSFAVNHMILPIELNNGMLEVVTYHPDNRHVLEDIERANQVTVRPYLSTRTDIKKILAEFFGFQRSITPPRSQFGDPGSLDHGRHRQSGTVCASGLVQGIVAPPTSTSKRRSITCSTMPWSSGPAIFISSPSGMPAWCGSGSTGRCTPSTSCPRRCIPPSPPDQEPGPAGYRRKTAAPGRQDQGRPGMRVGRRRSASPPCRLPSAKRRSCGSSTRMSSSRNWTNLGFSRRDRHRCTTAS
jgi:hypothetical protein